MIATVHTSRYGRARVWLNELPEAGYAVTDVLQSFHVAGKGPLVPANCAAVEVYSPRGGRVVNGLLGGWFKPSPEGQIVVQAAVSLESGQPIDWGIASSVDDVRVGLPREYAHAIMQADLSSESFRSVGSGVLRFDHAAHGAVGSSPSLFRQMAAAVAHLIAAGPEMLPEPDLVRLLRQVIT